MTWRRIGNLAIIVAVFAGAGPLVGLLVTAVGAGIATAIANDAAGGAAVTAFLLLYGWLFAHFVGIIAAVLAGCTVAAWAYVRGRVPTTVGAFAGLASAVLLALFSPYGQINTGGLESGNAAMLAILAAAHVVPGAVCTVLTRKWQ